MSEAKEGRHYQVGEGMPVSPDVELLLRTWPEPKVGDKFTYEAVEEVLGVTRKDRRWRSITDSWRKRMQDSGFVIECQSSTAFYVATAEQVSSATYGVMKGIGSKSRRHGKKLAIQAPRAENDTQRQVIEHQMRLTRAIETEARKARKNLFPPIQADMMPRIGPPSE